MLKAAGFLPALAAALGCCLAAAPARAIAYDDYHTNAEVQSQLEAWAKAHPELKLVTIGKSAGGRPIVVARIAGAGAVDPDARPAIFVGANLSGSHNAGTEAALDLIEKLFAGGDAAKLLATRTFYVAPV